MNGSSDHAPDTAGAPSTREREKDLPPEAGKRASVDPKTGEVHGSGAGAGGGASGEDYDSDRASGSGESETPGGLPQERVEDRPNVSIVKPEDYPEQQ